MEQLCFKFMKRAKRHIRTDIKPKPKLGERLGEGSSRIVFSSGRWTVLKLARNPAGIAQNRAEADICQMYGESLPLAPVLQHADDFTWLTMAKASRVGKAKYEQYVRLREDLDGICDDLHRDNIGFIGGKPVAIDYGYTEEVAKNYYYASCPDPELNANEIKALYLETF